MRISCLVLLLLLVGTSLVRGGETVNLFNGRDLSGWEAILGESSAPAATVFHVTPEGLLHFTGEPKGYLKTEQVFTRYRLVVEWRWVEKAGNSGVLLHVQGPDRVWPLCLEAQLKSSRAGDIVCIGVGAGGDFHDGTALVSDPEHPFYAADRMQASSEKPIGEWNRYEITTDGAELELVVNGVKQNTASGLTLTSGAIALQSEGAPIEFRTIRLESLE